MAANGAATGSGIRERVDRWLDSDLVGIPATLYTFGVLAVSLAIFRFGGPIAGIVVAVALWIPMVLFAIQGRRRAPAPLGISGAPAGPPHRVLVIANQSLEDPALFDELCLRGERTATEAMIVAPVAASSRLGDIAGDIDRELELARRRVSIAVKTLGEANVRASGHADIAQPMESLLDGLREFPPNEVVIASGRDAGWDAAGALAERVRAEAGLPVTEISPSSR
jgi:GABA permease